MTLRELTTKCAAALFWSFASIVIASTITAAVALALGAFTGSPQ